MQLSFIEKIFWMQSQLQLAHWQEPQSGFKHEVLGKYYKSLNKELDTLVECYSGIFSRSAIQIGDTLFIVKNNETPEGLITEILDIINSFRVAFEKHPALVNIIDDILTLTYQNKYLLELQ